MTLDEICALPVGGCATPDAVLYLWVTSPKLEEGLRVMREWGFSYRSCLVWVKDRIGMGYWARQRHELLLVGVRGNMPPPPTEARPDSVIEAPRGEHSVKPVAAYEMIERCFPGMPRLELFARRARDGWDRWGHEA
jgi:N6-adenosine-specific RNA methylase IME4